MENQTNTSTYNYTPLSEARAISTAFVVLIILICMALLIVGTLGNLLIIFTFVSSKKLRIKINVFIAALAIVDFLTVIYLLPFNIYYVLRNEKIELNGICAANGIISPLFFITSIQLIMMISVSRCIKICYFRLFDTLFTSSRICAMLISGLILTLVFVLPLSSNIDKFVLFDQSLHMCIFNRYGNTIYSVFSICICMGIPITITIICYIKIYITVSSSKRKINKSRPFRKKESFRLRGRPNLKESIKSSKTHFSVFIVYLLLYLPFGLTCIFRRATFSDNFHLTAIYLAFANSCINSILYGILNNNTRKEYRKLLGAFFQKKRRFTVSSTLETTDYGSSSTYRANDFSN